MLTSNDNKTYYCQGDVYCKYIPTSFHVVHDLSRHEESDVTPVRLYEDFPASALPSTLLSSKKSP